MNIPSVITDAIIKSPADNKYFYGADELWEERLTLIRNGQIKYINHDMADLANCYEMYLKGFIQASGINAPEDLMNDSHSLVRLVDCVESGICPLQCNMSRQDYRDRHEFLRDFGNKYITCRYEHDQVSKEEFNQVFDWVSKQRDLILSIVKGIDKDNTNHTDTFDDLD